MVVWGARLEPVLSQAVAVPGSCPWPGCFCGHGQSWGYWAYVCAPRRFLFTPSFPGQS